MISDRLQSCVGLIQKKDNGKLGDMKTNSMHQAGQGCEGR